MKKILLLFFTAVSLHCYSQDDSTKHWHKITLPDFSTIQVCQTKASFKVNSTDHDLSENLMVKYSSEIRFVNIDYREKFKRYTIYFPIEIKNDVLEYIQNISTER